MALEPISGRPLKWNPGRNPPGKAVYAVLATAEGLYIGSNTDYVGNFRYVRKKIAFFPYAGGAQLASTATGSVPGTVFLGGGQGTGTTNVLYRVNAGGPAIQSSDSGPDWGADSDATNTLRNGGSNAAGWNPVPNVDATVPAGTPSALFNTERWDPNDATEMQWHFPVAAGTPVQVRLYLANRCTCTSSPGSRKFDVDLNGSPWLANYDIVAAVGDQTGTMKTIDLAVPASGAVDLTWRHEVENPLVNGIEIVRTDVTPTPPSGVDNLAKVQLTTAGGGAPQAAAAGGIAWGSTRGAFMVGDTVFYGSTDGFMYRATFDGTTFGTPTQINPYHDPTWQNVDNHLGGTFDGNLPTLYSQFPNVTGMAYAAGRLYYTLFGDSTLHWRWFSPDSGIVDERVNNVASSVSFSDAGGMFITAGKLYYAAKSTGNLFSIAFDGTVTGSPTLVSGPTADGVNWRNRSLFLYAGNLNQLPTASFTANCSGASCTLNASASSDPDGTIASYAWDYGDGSTGAGVTSSHAYVATGTYTVTLTVTDDRGATASTTRSVSVTVPVSQVSFVGAAHSVPGSAKFKTATMPAGAAAGDQLLLFLSSPNTVTWTGPTGITGWTQVDSFTNGTVTSTLWRKAATAADLGQTVRVDDPSGFRLGTLDLAVYRGIATGTAPVTNHSGDSATANHVSSTVAAPSGSWVVTYWSDKSATTSTWTAPAGVTVRDSLTDTGGTRFSAFLVDSGAPVPAGSYGGLTATTNAASDKAVSWTIALSAA
jgi:PKD repeat protein